MTAEGSIDIRKVGAFRSLVMDVLKSKPKKVILDFRGVTFIDSGGIGVVSMLIGKLGLKFGQLKVVNSPNDICRIFVLTGLACFMEVCSTMEEALK